MKKVLALLLSALMVLSLVSVSFAANLKELDTVGNMAAQTRFKSLVLISISFLHLLFRMLYIIQNNDSLFSAEVVVDDALVHEHVRVVLRAWIAFGSVFG